MDAAQKFQLDQQAAERYERFLAPVMAPFVDALMAATDVHPGDAVLDIACGTGFVTRAAANRLEPDDRVVGSDLNPAMLAVGAHAAMSTIPSIEWRQASADDLPFDDHSFDVVLCQQGLQFMADLAAVMSSAKRVLRPGGRFAATVWSNMERSPYMLAQYESLAEILGADQVDSFRAAFAMTADRLRDAAEHAGFVDIEVAEIQCMIQLPPLPSFAADHLTALPWGKQLLDNGPGAVHAAAAAITGRLNIHRSGEDAVEVPFASILLTARS